MLTDPARYSIRVKGQVGPEWSEWFDGMAITHDETNETTLSGQVFDQAALYGILNKIQALPSPTACGEPYCSGRRDGGKSEGESR